MRMGPPLSARDGNAPKNHTDRKAPTRVRVHGCESCAPFRINRKEENIGIGSVQAAHFQARLCCITAEIEHSIPSTHFANQSKVGAAPDSLRVSLDCATCTAIDPRSEEHTSELQSRQY